MHVCKFLIQIWNLIEITCENVAQIEMENFMAYKQYNMRHGF